MIRQGVTPTFILKIPNSVDLTLAENVYATFKQGMIKVTKTGDEIEVNEHQVSVYMGQTETLRFEKGYVDVQLNWVYADGKRGETNIAKVEWDITLLREVLT